MNDSQTSLCDQCEKPVGKSGSMTQWIFDPSKCSCGTGESSKTDSTKLCSLCGCQITKSEGSLTQWIFKPRVCTCLVTEEQVVSEGIELPPNDAISGDRYHFQSVAGHGGAGTVFKAKDTKLGRAVAVKVIPGETVEESRQQEYFEREAKAASKLQHPNVVTVQDFGTMKDGRLFLVTEWIDGITLAQYLSRHGTLNIEGATEVFSQVLDALSHAHNRGVVHRDIKPNNIMLGRTTSGEWTVKVIDFGTAREVDEDINDTSVDNIACSPFYMSPEQAGGNVDQRTDLYSVGCSLFEALVGKPPFTGHPLSVVMRHQTEPPPHLSIAAGREFPEYIEQLIAKALEKLPENRFQTADDMKQALLERRAEAVTTSSKSSKNKLSTLRIAAIAIAVSAIAAGAGMMLTSTPGNNSKPMESMNVGKSFRVDEKLWNMGEVGGGTYCVNYEEEHARGFDPTIEGVRRISRFNVTRVDLFNTGVDDSVMQELGELKHLVSLNVTGTGLTDKTFAELLSKLPELRVVRAERTELTDSALKSINGMNNLRLVEVGNCNISAGALDDTTTPNPNLVSLGLSDTRVNDHTVERISKLYPSLTQLELTNTVITDASIPYILKLKNMNTLYLSNTKITDKGARRLTALRNLKALSIQTPGVSLDTLRYLDSRLKCRLLNADAIAEIDLGDARGLNSVKSIVDTP